MEAKKNPKKDLSRSSQMYFAVGLALILALVYISLEWETEYDNGGYTCSEGMEIDLKEETPPLVILKTPPPPQLIDISILEVTPDDFKGPETDIVVSHPIEIPIPVDSVDYIDSDPDVLIPINVVEVVPIFPGCENDKDKHACFNKMIQKHIRKNFRYPEIAQEMDIQGRVHILFEIQKDGSIGNVKLRGPDKTLEKEAARIIGKLPQMTPGKQGGKNVRVPFSIPITFKLQ